MRQQDIIESVTTGAITFVWYALPDVVPSRGVRALVKTALMIGLGAQGVIQGRRTADSDTGSQPGTEPSDDVLTRIRALTSTEPVLDAAAAGRVAAAPPTWSLPTLLVAGVVLVTGTIAGTVTAERGIHRYGQRLGARGVRWPHTRIGLVSGLAAGALSAGTAVLADRT